MGINLREKQFVRKWLTCGYILPIFWDNGSSFFTCNLQLVLPSKKPWLFSNIWLGSRYTDRPFFTSILGSVRGDGVPCTHVNSNHGNRKAHLVNLKASIFVVKWFWRREINSYGGNIWYDILNQSGYRLLQSAQCSSSFCKYTEGKLLNKLILYITIWFLWYLIISFHYVVNNFIFM